MDWVAYTFPFGLFSFSLTHKHICTYIFISLEVFSLSYELFISVLFCFQAFGGFPVIFSLLISSAILFWLKICFVAQDVVHLGRSSVGT